MDYFRIPYPQRAADPVWGVQTSPLNFCEEDYIITAWIAEFINTLSNFTYILYAAYGIRKFSNHKHFWSKTLPYWGISCVGATSALFHGTLRKWPQFSDDLSMLLATGIMFYRVFTYGKSEAEARAWAIGIVSYLIVLSTYHCWAAEKIVHNITFVASIALITRRTRRIVRERVKDPNLKAQLSVMAKTGSYVFLLAVFLWVVDQRACTYLKQIRQIVGLPWGFLFELHGWWHLLTSFAVYDYLVLVEILSGAGTIEENLLENSPFAWPASWQLSKTKSG